MGFYGTCEPCSILRTDTAFIDNLKVCLSSSPADSLDGIIWVCPERSVEAAADAEPVHYSLNQTIPGDVRDVLSDAAAVYDFDGAAGSSCHASAPAGSKFRSCFLVGCGEFSSSCPVSQYTKAGACAASLVKTHKLTSLFVGFEDEAAKDTNCAAAFLTSLLFNLCPDDLYKSGTKKNCKLTSLWVTFNCPMDDTAFVNKCKVVAKGQRMTADLIDAPSNYCTCVTFAEEAKKMSQQVGLDCLILNENDCDKMKMGLFLGVAKGSRFGARLVHLTYRSKDFNASTGKKLAYVGKGITMDTGGYNIKTDGGSIGMMKIDMGGGATLLGTAFVVGSLKPSNTEVHFIVPTCENMVSQDAYRPGDVLTASNGKTVEIGNTDAEGRLVLADGLVYAEKQLGGPGQGIIVDIATLTGSAIVALGIELAAVYGNHCPTKTKLLEAFKHGGDGAWGMPLYRPYAEQLNSKLADMNNLGKGRGGSITAALFLEKFVDKKTNWCHIDAPYCVITPDTRGNGYGVAGLTNFVNSL